MAERTIPADTIGDIAHQLGYDPATVSAIRIQWPTVEVDTWTGRAGRGELDTYRHRIRGVTADTPPARRA